MGGAIFENVGANSEKIEIDSSSSSNSSSLTDLKIDTQTGTVTIVAKDNKIPIVLAAIADKVENVPTPPKV